MTTRKRHTREHVVRQLIQADELLADGKDVPTSDASWRSGADLLPMADQCGGLKADDAKKLQGPAEGRTLR